MVTSEIKNHLDKSRWSGFSAGGAIHPDWFLNDPFRLESALVRLARNQFTWGEMGRLRIVEW